MAVSGIVLVSVLVIVDGPSSPSGGIIHDQHLTCLFRVLCSAYCCAVVWLDYGVCSKLHAALHELVCTLNFGTFYFAIRAAAACLLLMFDMRSIAIRCSSFCWSALVMVRKLRKHTQSCDCLLNR